VFPFSIVNVSLNSSGIVCELSDEAEQARTRGFDDPLQYSSAGRAAPEKNRAAEG
jgi:hypothetical protein